MDRAAEWRVKDGREWRLGTEADVAWIRDGTLTGRAITSAVPAVFDAYATLELPRVPEQQQDRHDAALIDLLQRHTVDQPWWLGYLDTGVDDVVFPDARRVSLYADWGYVLVQAGPREASTWRTSDSDAFWMRSLPDLMFPADRSWLLSTLWDDDWSCIGGPALLVDDGRRDPELGARARSVDPKAVDATPPGHEAR